MRGYINGPDPKQIVILYRNTGLDGTKHLPKFLDFVLPLHRNAVLEPTRIKTTSQLPAVARFPDKAWAERFLETCLKAAEYEVKEGFAENHFMMLPWSEAQSMCKTR